MLDKKSMYSFAIIYLNSIKHRFKIEEIPFYNLENSEFYNYCTKAGLFCAVQGYIHENINTPDAVQYPIVCISGDIRTLEKLVVPSLFPMIFW